MNVTVGVLALQGAFYEHLQLLKQASRSVAPPSDQSATHWIFLEVRTTEHLSLCDALIIPGGESTTISLVAARSNLLDPLRDFVKLYRKPTWGTCAGLILLAESANRTKHGGQDLIGGLDVRVNRNHFGRQVESFQAPLRLPFLDGPEGKNDGSATDLFPGIFIRAPVVERILPNVEGLQVEEQRIDETIVAPTRTTVDQIARDAVRKEVQVMATLPGRAAKLASRGVDITIKEEAGDIIAVRQGNVFGTSFHPELTGDPRIHIWWLQQVREAVMKRREAENSSK